MGTGYIYKIVNNLNNKVYIGKTIKSLDVRFKEHITTAKRWAKEEAIAKPHPYKSRLYPAMNKYGYNNFNILLVATCDEQNSLEDLEKYWIDYYNARDEAFGYNISPGGYGGPLFLGHKQSDYCKQVNSQKSKGIKQSKAFVEKRSYARARLMQDLESGKIYSVLDIGIGKLYEQSITTEYRIFRISGKFYVCLEQPHNRKVELNDSKRKELLADLQKLFDFRHEHTITALHTGLANIEISKRLNAIQNFKKTVAVRRSVLWETFMQENNINAEEYTQLYMKYKNTCPNQHLALIYNIPYTKVRNLNKYLNLSGGGSGHPSGKISIEETN